MVLVLLFLYAMVVVYRISRILAVVLLGAFWQLVDRRVAGELGLFSRVGARGKLRWARRKRGFPRARCVL